MQQQPRLRIKMILKEFSKYLQARNVYKNPKNHVDKIVHREIMLAENSTGDFFIVGKSDSGRVLVNALYNFALSYEHYIMSKWLQDKKANDFSDK